MELRQIRYALSVAKERSFTRAAERLNVSQSAVSEQVKMLEDTIGFSLFRRTPRGIEVTEQGRSFIYEAERVIGDFASLGDIARRLKRAPSETLALAIGSGIAQIVIPRLFGEVREALRAVRLEIITTSTKMIFAHLAEERVDIGLAMESDPDQVPPGIVFEPVAEAEMVLITHPAHPLARSHGPVDLGRLVLEPIVMSELSVGYGRVVHGMFADLGIRPNILAVADNIETIKVIVQCGGGIGIVPRACVESEVALGLLRALAVTPPRNIHIYLYRRRQPLSRRKESHLALVRTALMA